MIWFIFTLISAAFLLAGITIAIIRWRRDKNIVHWITPSTILFIFVGIAAVAWFFPICITTISNPIFATFASVQSALRLFVVDDGFLERMENMGTLIDFSIANPSRTPYYIRSLLNKTVFEFTYYIVGGILFLLAPALTFHMVITFIKNLVSKFKYVCSPKRNVHIFSELNEKSLALATSMTSKEYKRTHGGRPVIIFADIIDKKEEEHLDLINGSKNIRAILFRLDLCAIRFSPRGNKNFYLISDDEAEKARHTTYIIEKFKNNKKTKLFIFSDSTESKCFLDSFSENERKEMALRIIRVNDIRALIYHNLEKNGLALFKTAKTLPNGNREISAIIVGLGRYGMELLKALLWYCQFPGYSIRITAIDESEHIRERIQTLCPSIKMDMEHTAIDDAKYCINVVSAKVGTESFNRTIRDIDSPTYIFVGLGDDATNVSTAIDIRCRLGAINKKAAIETVVYDSTLKERINWEWDNEKDGNTKNDMQKYDIHVIGDLASFYSYNTVIGSELIEKGYVIHSRWDNKPENKKKNLENNFYMNNYNFFSSLASTLHRDLRTRIGAMEESERHLFPAIYSDAAAEMPWASPQLLRSALGLVADRESAAELSHTMKLVSDCLYSKLAQLHYKNLSVENRAEVLAALHQQLEDEQPFLPARRKGKNPPSEPVWQKLLQLPENDPEHLEGIDSMLGAYLVTEADVKTCKKCQKRQNFGRCAGCRQRTKCDMAREWDNVIASRRLMKDMFTFIVEAQYAKTPHSTHKPTFKQGYEYEALSPEDKLDVRNLMMAAGLGEPEQYLTLARSFAYLEHVRWNAYMRTEGYSFCNRFTSDLKKYKLHGDLVPVSQLSFADCIKDI